MKRECNCSGLPNLSQNDMPLRIFPRNELLMYYWYLHYQKQQHFNAWAKISQKIPTTTPSLIKNLFYSNAKTTLKKISKCKRYVESKEDMVRRAFYVYCSRVYLLDPKHEKRDYFKKLVDDLHFNYDNLIKYAEDINANWTYDVLIHEIELLLHNESLEDSILSHWSLPITSEKILPPINFTDHPPTLTFDEKSTVLYFLLFPRILSANPQTLN